MKSIVNLFKSNTTSSIDEVLHIYSKRKCTYILYSNFIFFKVNFQKKDEITKLNQVTVIFCSWGKHEHVITYFDKKKHISSNKY
jgi:hypothetical protein